MNSKEKGDIKDIAKHVHVLNEEVGKLKSDVKWIKKIIFYMAGIISVGVGKVIFFS